MRLIFWTAFLVGFSVALEKQQQQYSFLVDQDKAGFRRFNETDDLDRLIRQGVQEMRKYGFVQCRTCSGLVGTAAALARRNISDGFFESLGVTICSRFGIQPKEICDAVVPHFTPWLLRIARDENFSTQKLCSALGSCANKLDPWEPQFPRDKPPKRNRPPIDPFGKKKWVVHMSDWHYDDKYHEGFEADCSDPICCRVAPTNSSLPIKRPAGLFGDYRCDSPKILAESVLKQVLKVVPNMDFVLMSGDLPPHDVWSTTREAVIEAEGEVARQLQTSLIDIPVYMTIGNHESSPPNSFPAQETASGREILWLYESLARQWSPWLRDSERTTLSKLGFYSTRRSEDNLKIISLNTNHAYLLNWWIFIADSDPDNMLHWLIKELQDSEDIGEDVYILGHIPPGSSDVSKDWSAAYYKIIQRYEDVILGQFFGHSHRDEFQIFYADEVNREEPVGVAYLCPSITTYPGLNPGFRVYETDAVTNRLLNHQTWIMDLDTSNVLRMPVWSQEYDAKSAYNMKGVSPFDWHQLTLRMLEDQALLEKYLKFRTKSSSLPQPPCDKKCQRQFICSMQTAKSASKCKDFTARRNGFVSYSLLPEIEPYYEPNKAC